MNAYIPFNEDQVLEQTVRHTSPAPFVRAKGTHRQIGQQIGEAMAESIRHSIQNARNLLDQTYDSLNLTWEGGLIQASKYMPFAQERYPQYVDEMIGMAEGAGVPPEDLAVVTGMEAVTQDALHLTKCTSLAVNGDRTADGHVLVAHNEDWLPEDEQDVYVVHATPDDEPPWIAMTYGGLLPNIGFNAYGIAQCCDSVYPNDSRIGIPRVVVSRAVLGAHNLEDAFRSALVPRRAAGYNHVLVHDSGELYSLEVSARKFGIVYGGDGIIVHTNHFLDEKMQAIEDEPEELIGTRLRYFRTRRLLQQTDLHTIKSLQAIQRDHLNFPNAICNHCWDDSEPLDREKTVCALIMDLTARVMHLAWGNPCANQYHTYHLDC